VTRRVILEAAAEVQLPVVERRFTPKQAGEAREAFISSASGAAVPVVSIDGKKVGDGKPGPLTRRIAELYARKSGMAAAAAEQRPGLSQLR
jgi:D-alanine transaminase